MERISLIELGQSTDNPPVLTVPGIDGSIGSVKPVAESLAEGRKILVADYSREENETLDGLMEELTELCAGLPYERIDLLGQSIGTVMTAYIAGNLKDRINRVALMCTFTKLRWRTLRVSTFMMGITPDWLYRITTIPIMAAVCGPVGDGWDHPFFAASRAAEKQRVRKRTAWQIDRNFSPILEGIQAPLMVLMGENDRFVPDAGEEIAKLRRLLSGDDAEVRTIPEAGHVFLPSDAIERASGILKEFYQ